MAADNNSIAAVARDSISVNGTAGNDYIDNNYGDFVTINLGAGTGNDTVSLYASSANGDVITYIRADDTLSITCGSYSTQIRRLGCHCHGRRRLNYSARRGKSFKRKH